MQPRQFRVAILALLLLVCGASHAALLGRAPLTPSGTDYQAYYDTTTNLTWVADANLAKTSGYDAFGLMTWAAAQTWIGTLNTASYLGVNNWRLPTVTDTGTSGCDFAFTGTDCGYNVDLSTGEMARMFYGTLGNTGYYNTSGTPTGCSASWPYCLTNTGPFANLQPSHYWSGTQYAPDTSHAWVFDFIHGSQDGVNPSGVNYAWAVRPGDIALAHVDSDGDGVFDDLDNCTLVPNPDQRDTDADGYGNMCDADLDNNGTVNINDFNRLKSRLNITPVVDVDADLDGNNAVNINDFNRLKSYLNKPPGPSGLHPSCPPTCA